MKTTHSFLPKNLVARMQENALLEHHLKAYLAPVMRENVAVVGCKNGQLRLLVANQTLATALRYQQQELIKHFNTVPDLNIQSIFVRVSPSLRK